MKLLVTRPASQAAEWVAWLRERGIDAEALPLIGISPPRDAAPVREAWARLAAVRLGMFVSPNAAEQFFALRPAGAAWPGGTDTAYSKGSGRFALSAPRRPPADSSHAAAAPMKRSLSSRIFWVSLSASRRAGHRARLPRPGTPGVPTRRRA